MKPVNQLSSRIVSGLRNAGSTPSSSNPFVTEADVGFPTVLTYAPASTTELTAPYASSAAADATNLDLAFVVPPSGSVLVELEGFLLTTTGTTVYWGCSLTSKLEMVFSDQAETGTSSRRRASIPVSGLTPGATAHAIWTHEALVADAAKLVCGVSASSTYERTAVIKVTPLAA